MNDPVNLELGLIGLGTMGMSLLLNMADHGHAVAGYHRDAARLQRIRAAALPNLHGFDELAGFVRALRRPRVVMLLVPAGAAEKIRTVAHVLNIAWVADALATPASVICPLSSACPRQQTCPPHRPG